MNTKYDFCGATDQIVYVKQVAVAALPEEVQEQAEGFDHLFAVHDANGQQIALVTERRLAFALAKDNDLTAVTLH